MSAGEWKPGDVALVRNEHGIWNTAILQVQPRGLRWVYGVAYADAPTDWPAQRLVVINPDDAEQVERLTDGLYGGHHGGVTDRVQAALRKFANPTPPEPEPTVTDAEARAMRTALARLDRMEGRRFL